MANGVDGIFPEFIKHCGPNTRKWLAYFFTNVMISRNLPSPMKLTKIIAILKTGKQENNAGNYRPIALLSSINKLFERLIYIRILPIINEHILIEQAGFRPSRECTKQAPALTTYIECGFDNQLKTAVLFIDLTATYNTV